MSIITEQRTAVELIDALRAEGLKVEINTDHILLGAFVLQFYTDGRWYLHTDEIFETLDSRELSQSSVGEKASAIKDWILNQLFVDPKLLFSHIKIPNKGADQYFQNFEELEQYFTFEPEMHSLSELCYGGRNVQVEFFGDPRHCRPMLIEVDWGDIDMSKELLPKDKEQTLKYFNRLARVFCPPEDKDPVGQLRHHAYMLRKLALDCGSQDLVKEYLQEFAKSILDGEIS